MTDARSDERRAVAHVVDAAGLGPLVGLERIPGGGNNRAYRGAGARPLFIKLYYRDPGGGRDRASTEHAFARSCWDLGLRELAEPLALDAERGIGVFAFMEGRRLAPSEVDEGRVGEALAFFERINSRSAGSTAAARLPLAAEACFSISDHVAVVEGRVERLRAVVGRREVEGDARRFVAERLVPAWSEIRARVGERALGLEDREANRCLSPSDFGFHNALLGSDGRLLFHDFEYAGWDDPAKLVGDFFCQVEIPAPQATYHGFVDRVSAALDLRAADRERIELLRPLFRVKWCCIILNELLPEGRARRRFAGCASAAGEAEAAEPSGAPKGETLDGDGRRQLEQLAKAERMLAGLVP